MSKLPIASKARDGPRWAEADAPVIHVPGVIETARLPKMKAAKRAAPIGPVEALPIIAEMRERFVATAVERDAIRKRKESGQPWPWTANPIMRDLRLCNAHREHDYGSYCVSVKLVQPFREHPDLWFGATAVRCINEPAAWIELGTLGHLTRRTSAVFSKRGKRAARRFFVPTPTSRRRHRMKGRAQSRFWSMTCSVRYGAIASSYGHRSARRYNRIAIGYANGIASAHSSPRKSPPI
jgi:hypothetical protein